MALVVGQTYTADGSSTNKTWLKAGIDYQLVNQDQVNKTSKIRIFPWIYTTSGGYTIHRDAQNGTCSIGSYSTTYTAGYDSQVATKNTKIYLTTANSNNWSGANSFQIRSIGQMKLVDGKYCYEVDFPHNADGTLTDLQLYCVIPTQNPASGASTKPINSIVNITVDLPPLWQPSSISLPYGLPYIGQSITVNINRASSNFTDSVMAWFQITPENGVTDFYPLLAVNKTSLSQVNLEFNNTVLRQILGGANKDKLSIPMFITCETFNGNTSVGSTQTATMNMNVQRINPVITAPAIIDINDVTKAFTGDNTKIIKYLSKPKITVNATAQQYADIKWYSISADGQTYYEQEHSFYDGIANPATTVNAMDTRNWENPTVYNLSSLGKWIDYEKIILNCEYCERIEQTSSTIKCKLKGFFFNNTINGIANSLTISYRYRKQGENWQDNWINIDDVTINGNNFTVDIPSLRTDCSDLDSWEFQFRANDILMTTPIITKQITLGLGVLELAKEFANFNVDLFVKDYPVLTVKKIEKVVI